MYNSKITGLGYYVPETIVTNEDLSKMMDTNDAWIQERTGIKERRWIQEGSEDTSAVMGAKASRIAIERAGIDKDDIDIYFNQHNSSFDINGNNEIKIDFLYEKPLKESRDLFETMYLKYHLNQNKSITELSKKTGIERTHLYRKLKQLGIKT